jgi:hypothetical protein
MLHPLVPRPPLAFRVGVSGARKLPPDSWEALRPAVARVLSFVSGEVSGLATTPEALAAYRCNADRTPQMTLVLVSPLAEGSDRLVAETALQMGYRLETPLPFTQAEYERDFPRTVDSFWALLAHGRTIALDGGRGDEEMRSYEAVGRFVVRNCDLLIAIWDGKPAKGRGGTEEVVQFAVQSGIPVWWLNSEGDSEPRLIESPPHLRELGTAPNGQKAEQALTEILGRTILPPPATDLRGHGLINRLADYSSFTFYKNHTPLDDYLQEAAPRRHWVWQSYSLFMRMLTSRATEAIPAMAASGEEIERWWDKFYRPADQLSLAYGDRYRSSYTLITFAGYWALVAAVLALSFQEMPAVFHLLLGSELLGVIFIGGLVIINRAWHWHERWISYRLLAELCRKQRVLSSLGWSLPRWEVQGMASDDQAERVSRPFLREAWVAWYFTAVTRAAPLPAGPFTHDVLRRVQGTGRGLLSEQIEYHRARQVRSDVASRKLSSLAKLFFLATLLSVVARLFVPLPHSVEIVIEICTIILPAASAAMIGVRAYAEFELLAHQSVRMRRVMTEGLLELDRLDLERPLASQDLAAVLGAVATRMMEDIQGWAQLFRVKIVEIG